MNILITGGSGFVGKKLIRKLKESGHNTLILTRNGNSLNSAKDKLFWNNCYQLQNPQIIPEQLDLVINLMGENLSAKRWTETQKKELRDSRIISSRELQKQLKELKKMPKRWIQASAIGIYPKNTEDTYNEDSPQTGNDFLATLCKEWETVLPEESENQIIRIGLVLEKKWRSTKKITPYI